MMWTPSLESPTAMPSASGCAGSSMRSRSPRRSSASASPARTVVRAGLDKTFQQILETVQCTDIRQFQALLAMGLVKGERHLQAQARYGLYERYFTPRLHA